MEPNKQLFENYLQQANKTKAGKGIIMIPDLSGFTDFVSSICLEAGRFITYELLSTLIDHNKMGMKVSEIEGDAILCYQFGNNPSIPAIITQYEIMLEAFYSKLAEIETIVGHRLGLSLKMIVHYGEFSEYRIGAFKKLYGEAVIKAHALLKNPVTSNTYILLTNELLEAGNSSKQHEDRCKGYDVHDYQHSNSTTFYNSI